MKRLAEKKAPGGNRARVKQNTTTRIIPPKPPKSSVFEGITSPNGTAADTITVLGCVDAQYRATKIHERTSSGITTKGYNAGMFFRQYAFNVTGIQHLSLILSRIERDPHTLGIRGNLDLGLDPIGTYRRTSNDPPNFQTPAAWHQWAMLDIDKLPLPKGLRLTPRRLKAVLEYVISRLPVEFRDA